MFSVIKLLVSTAISIVYFFLIFIFIKFTAQNTDTSEEKEEEFKEEKEEEFYKEEIQEKDIESLQIINRDEFEDDDEEFPKGLHAFENIYGDESSGESRSSSPSLSPRSDRESSRRTRGGEEMSRRTSEKWGTPEYRGWKDIFKWNNTRPYDDDDEDESSSSEY